MKKLYLILIILFSINVFALDVYLYNNKTGEYKGSRVARRDPLDSEKFLIPKNSTLIVPPHIGDNEVRIWNGKEWEIHSDYRGFTYYNTDGSLNKITDIDTELPENAITQAPPKSYKAPQYIDGEWIETAKYINGILVKTRSDIDLVKTRILIGDLLVIYESLNSVIAGEKSSEGWEKLVKKIEAIDKEASLLNLKE